VGSMAVSWLLYDFLCRSRMAHNNPVVALSIFGWFALLAWLLSECLSGRAAYIHVGAAIGTIMVANVFFVIIPAQKELVAAVRENRVPRADKGKSALARSRHNNYFTLPVLFIMISNHYAGTYAHSWNWLVLVLLGLAGVGIRHWFNIRHLPRHNRWVLPLSVLLLAGLIFFTKPQPAPLQDGNAIHPTSAVVMPLIEKHCVNCHADQPAYPGFTAPPLGVVLDSEARLEANAWRVHQSAVVTRIMPLGNLTGMTEEEREVLARWYAGLGQQE
jgi:uncharacterized membrane protein